MIEAHLDPVTSVLTLRPKSALEIRDLVDLAKTVDPLIEAHGDLAGLIIEAPQFPGWDSFGALVTHIRFVRDHHRHIARIAVVTDSPLGDAAEHIAAHFVAAQIRHFPAGAIDEARDWISAR